MSTVVRDVAYAPEYGFRGEGDLFLPANPDGAKTVLVVHGGGWGAMDRFRFGRVCEWLADSGYVSFNINYRLTGQAPWPACGDDCLRAARFLLDAGQADMAQLARDRIAVMGASAGGHLALMTGLRLPSERVAGIVDIAGPADLRTLWAHHGPEKFGRLFGKERVSQEELFDASPVSHVKPASPPLLCVQSTNDRLVPPAQTEAIAAAYEEQARPCKVFSFAGAGEAHGIWQPPVPDVPDLLPEINDQILAFLNDCF
jgi:alpha-L-fucosidase 2